MNKQIELQRNDVTLAEFFRYIKNQCAEKGIDLGIDRDGFENPTIQYDGSYHVKDGTKYVRTGDGSTQKRDGSDAPAQAETARVKPLDYQIYILNHDGSCYNEICEFTFDGDKRGHGYYYQMSRDAPEQKQEQASGADILAEARKTANERLDSPILTSAQPGRTYSGQIIGLLGELGSPDGRILMAVSDSHAILHDARGIPADTGLKVGEELTLATDGDGLSSIKARGKEQMTTLEQTHSREGHKR